METLSTGEHYAAAFLMARGIRLVGILPGQYVLFSFSDEDGQATAALHDWREGDDTVSARTFGECLRECRRLSYNHRTAA